MAGSPGASGSRKARGALLAAPAIAASLIASACGSTQPAKTTASAPPPALVAEARPIGQGAAFQPSASGPVLGPCAARLGRRDGVHVEVFAANRVVLIPAGIGTRPPRSYSSGRIARAICYGQLVTLDPTGVVLVRPGARLELGDLFKAWGQPLSTSRLLSFTAPGGTQIRVFVDGRPWRGAPGRVPMRPHDEIVLEVGPYVPPHATYTFPPGT
jgi:hypothetical protein